MDEITKQISKNPKNIIKIGEDTLPGCLLWMDDVLLMHTDPKQMQSMLNTTNRIADRYRIKFGTEKSKIIQICTKPEHMTQYTIGESTLLNTDTYKYLGITINKDGNLLNHIKELEGKITATTQSIINLPNTNSLKRIQIPTTWKL